MARHRVETYEEAVERAAAEAMQGHADAWISEERARTGCTIEEAAERFVTAHPRAGEVPDDGQP